MENYSLSKTLLLDFTYIFIDLPKSNILENNKITDLVWNSFFSNPK